MKRYLNFITILPALFLLLGMAACSDWREKEPLDLEFDRIQDESSPVYQAYLANLREYKQTDHRIMVGWFDNTQGKTQYVSRGNHLTSVPDSMDVVVLLSPDDLDQTIISEMKKIKREKGILTLYEIDCLSADRTILRTIDQEVREGATTDEDARYLELFEEWFRSQVTLLGKYEYDGLCLYYNGYTPTEIITPDIYERMEKVQDIIFENLASVYSADPDKLYFYEGFAENVLQPASRLAMFDYYVLRMTESDNTGAADVLIDQMWKNTEVPRRPFIPMVQTFSLDNDGKTGVFFDRDHNARSAITEMAYWVPENGTVTKAGIGVYNMQRDYYNQELDYKYMREGIGIMNPAPFI
ncbi:MAG: glycoside hydrolase family 18 [Rikenellaceae bacterium]|nr:glycoside hydrolase family 18 [Rikenellaceae bacterium]